MIEQFDPDIIIPHRPVYGVIVDGVLCSECMSSRENRTSDETWVYTRPRYRRLGYASQVTLARAQSLRQQEKIPFYSHRVENVDSEVVARRLVLIQYIADAAYV